MTFKRKKLALLGTVAVAGLAYAAIVTQIQLKPEITLSEGGNGHKPKIQRASDGTLVSAFGDSPASVGDVYDTKGDVDRPARDIYVKYCKPSATKTCDLATDWTKATTAFGTDGNVSNQATKSSMSSAWDDDTPGVLKPYLGDTDKPNIKTSGPVMVLTWVGKYCPNGDLQAVDVDGDVNTNQRAVRYLERKSRVIPFSCTWAAYSTNNGQTWAAPVQLSNGERDAKQDASFGSYDSVSKTGKLSISWQEDPKGLQLGESDGPGDGASGANVSNGTDVWYAYGNIDMNSLTDKVVIAKNTAPVVGKEDRAFGFRLTDNYTKDGIGGTDAANPVFNALGTQVDKDTIESGGAGAARPNIAMVSNQTVLAYEETKGSEGLDEGKFIRYHTFSYNTVPTDAAGKAGCIISNPQKNARRVRFLTQSAAAATGVTAPAVPGRSGVNIAIFWKEGIYDKGGPSDIVLRRGMVDPAVASNVQSGLKTTQMVPAVDAACAALDYTASQTLSNLPGDNISSRADRLATLGVTGLTDSTETDYYENALAHRGVLRGNQLWVGYNYTPDLVAMWNQDTNYNFWLRKFTFDGSSNSVGGSWGLPFNVSNETDTNVNVREPRIFGTPASNTGAGFCDNADPTLATDPTFCQNADVVYVMWGSQENVNPFNIEGGADLGVWGSASLDGGANFLPKVRISEEMGSLFNDDESAFETQPVTRPDGTRFYAMFNTETFDPITKAFISAAARYRSGDIVQVDDGTVPGTTPSTDGGGGGCTAATGKTPVDPMLPLFAALGLIGWGLRRARRS